MNNINWLKSQEARKYLSIELNSRFAALDSLEDETDQDSVECSWNKIKESYADAEKKADGFKKKKTKKCLSAETWDRIGDKEACKKSA